jgi:phage terminase large subunit GpA-like protein
MEADYVPADCGDEMWSNWICPDCGQWQELEDYERVKTTKEKAP